jgi:hypothetical protein
MSRGGSLAFWLLATFASPLVPWPQSPMTVKKTSLGSLGVLKV